MGLDRATREGPSTQQLGTWVLGKRDYSTGFG